VRGAHPTRATQLKLWVTHTHTLTLTLTQKNNFWEYEYEYEYEYEGKIPTILTVQCYYSQLAISYLGGGFLRLCKKSGISNPGGDFFGSGDGEGPGAGVTPKERLGAGVASLATGID